MRVDLPGQLEMPIRAATIPKMAVSGTKAELGVRLAKALVKYEERPSSELWIEIQACAKAILNEQQ